MSGVQDAVKAPGGGQKGKWSILVFVCLSVFLVNGFIFTTFNLLLQTITVDLGWTGEQRAAVASAFPTGMMCFIFIFGMVLDKFSVKKLLGIFQLITAVTVILRGTTSSATIFFAVMFIFGMCFAMLSPAHTKLVGLWFGQKDIAVANGALTSASPLGQLAGNLAAFPIIGLLGGNWQRIFLLQGILLAVLGVCTLLFARDRRNIDAELSSNMIQSEEDLGVWKNIKGIAKVPQLWIYVLANGCFLGMVYGGGAMTYTVLQVDPRWALAPHMPGIVTAMNNISSMIFYVVAPVLIGKLLAKNYERNYRRVAVFCGFFSGIVMMIGWRTYSFVGICICYLLSGITFGQIVPVPKVLMLKLPQVSGPRAGTALGIFLTVDRLAQMVITAAVGLVLAGNPDNGAVTMSWLCLLYVLSPILILIAMGMDKHQAKKNTPTPAAAT